ncbi:response regulator transcription factor [Nocardioides sp. SR21]|uniref:response regulator transcription factor n=1 Tax=Nocardioides sp. SR21 TaxID=2919501 RepID=UPI001FAA6BD0|nr:response regulator [Nocardioides sp. SR21]
MSEASVSAKPVALVIDDDQDTVDLLQIVLAQAGFAVISASNGPDGIALALQHRPALATIDVTMPDMNGLEVTRRIREVTGTGMYIVIISSRSQEHDILAGFDAGADDYVPKPIRPRELQARLAAVARRPVETVTSSETAAAWAPAAENAERSAFVRQVLAGENVGFEDDDSLEEDEDGLDGRDGMLDLGMRFVGSWIEFRGLRINPSRDLLVVDDRIVDVPAEQVKMIEILLYAGTHVLTARQLALRTRGETEARTDRPAEQDRKWFNYVMTGLLKRIGDDGPTPRWFHVSDGKVKLVRAVPEV